MFTFILELCIYVLISGNLHSLIRNTLNMLSSSFFLLRFSCTNDLVPLAPFCNFKREDLQFYKHVGMRVQLHGVGRFGRWRLQKSMDVSYPLHFDLISQVKRVLMNSPLANLNTLHGKSMSLSLSGVGATYCNNEYGKCIRLTLLMCLCLPLCMGG